MSDETDLQWGRRTYERHLDLIIAEEIECNPVFARWIVDRCDFGEAPPSGLPNARVRVGYFDDLLGVAGAFGEDDLRVELSWPDEGTNGIVLIEDKLDAVLQPLQIERYAARVALCRAGGLLAAAAILAPQPYLDRRRESLGLVNTIGVESIVDELRRQAYDAVPEVGRRLEWRASRLVELARARREPAPTDPEIVALRDWIIAELFLLDPRVQADSASMRTANTTWLYFLDPAGLIFKLSNGIVDLYLRDLHPDVVDEQGRLWSGSDHPHGFAPDMDSKQNLVLRWGERRRVSVESLWRDAGPADESFLRSGIAACVEAAEWVRRVAGEPERRTRP